MRIFYFIFYPQIHLFLYLIKEILFFSQKITLGSFNLSLLINFSNDIVIDTFKIRFTNFRKLDSEPLKILNQTLASSYIYLIKMQKFLIPIRVSYYFMSEIQNLLIVQIYLLNFKLKSLVQQIVRVVKLLYHLGYFIAAQIVLKI